MRKSWNGTAHDDLERWDQPQQAAGFLGHPDYLHGAAAAIGQKGRHVSVVETVVNLTEDRNQKKKPNDFWSEWQDSNLRPLRPERSALPG
jgi:hypothetical protein